MQLLPPCEDKLSQLVPLCNNRGGCIGLCAIWATEGYVAHLFIHSFTIFICQHCSTMDGGCFGAISDELTNLASQTGTVIHH